MVNSVSRQTGPDRFEISVDGASAGLAQFVDHDGHRVFFHTEVDPAFSGQGLAGQLVGEALAATVEEGLKIVAVCPYVKKFVGKDEEKWGAHTAPATPDLIAAIPRG